MKKLLLYCLAAFFLLSAPVNAGENVKWRCGAKIIQLGMHDFEVLENCGEPNSKEEVGSTGDRRLNLVIEKWVYGPVTGGYMYILYFKAGILSKLDSYRPK